MNKLEKIKKQFKKNHQYDGKGNPCYDSMIEEIYLLTEKIKGMKHKCKHEFRGKMMNGYIYCYYCIHCLLEVKDKDALQKLSEGEK